MLVRRSTGSTTSLSRTRPSDYSAGVWDVVVEHAAYRLVRREGFWIMHAAAAADALEREGLPDATSFQRSKARERGRSDHQPSDGESPNRRGCVPQEHRLFGGRHSLGRRTYLPEVITADTREVGHVGCRVGTGSRETDCLPLSDPSRLHHRGALRRRDRRSHSLARSRPQTGCAARFPRLSAHSARHFFKDGRANAREGITAATAELAELREETKKLARLVARFRDDELRAGACARTGGDA